MQKHNIPQHIAIIMDGNGRWAKSRGLPRVKGHEQGAERVEEISRAADQAGVKYLTLYAFSKENWSRPKDEVSFLMQLLAHYLDAKIKTMMKDNVVFDVIGEVSDLPHIIQEKIQKAREISKDNTGLHVTFALSYSSRFEITRACKSISEKVKEGQIDLDNINEELIAKNLYTHNMPDPDLLVRTSGEMRLSNFLLWQLSYSELYITEKLWPDFTKEEFIKAMDDFSKRERRFGLTEGQVTS